MLYIYDILLNWNRTRLYDFFEWEKLDRLDHIKKIPLIRVDKGIINNLIYKSIKVDSDFISKIYNLTEIYTSKKTAKIPYACLITDGAFVIAIKMDKTGVVKYRSKLIIDEEEEILCFCNKLAKTNIKIDVLGQICSENFLTRKEILIKNFLLREIENSYSEENFEKLNYLYTEYFDKSIDDNSKMYLQLKNSLDGEINYKHHRIYDLLNLTANKN